MEQVRGWQQRFEAESGEPFVFLSDEWYYITDKPFPKARHYGNFAQIENGVGMTRAFLDDWKRARRKLPSRLPEPTHITLITATMANDILAKITAELNQIENLTVDLLPVVNGFFGPLVTVAGLLCGNDILDALAANRAANVARDTAAKRLILLPRIVLDNPGKQFLDDLSVADFQQQAGDPVIFAKDVSEVMEMLDALAVAALPDELVLVGGR